MKNITSEKEFENLIRNIIQQDVLTKTSGFTLLKNKKAVDILICREKPNPTLFFIEIKYHKKNHGRLGVGQGKGGGFQPELLEKRPVFFESNLRWILGTENNESFYLLNNDRIYKYLNAGRVGEKYNGLQKKIYTEEIGITREKLAQSLLEWLTS